MTREDLIAALGSKPVPFEACGVTVFVKPMSADERGRFAAEHKVDESRMFARALVYGLCDAAGARLFAPNDLDAAGSLDGIFAERVALRVLDLNGMGGDGPKV